MYTFMYFQTTCVPECYITHITEIWKITSMYTLMYFQIFRLLECFTAHITLI